MYSTVSCRESSEFKPLQAQIPPPPSKTRTLYWLSFLFYKVISFSYFLFILLLWSVISCFVQHLQSVVKNPQQHNECDKYYFPVLFWMVYVVDVGGSKDSLPKLDVDELENSPIYMAWARPDSSFHLSVLQVIPWRIFGFLQHEGTSPHLVNLTCWKGENAPLKAEKNQIWINIK